MFFVNGFGKQKLADGVKVGACYRHVGPHRVIETAQVLKVGNDAQGIPHVHFAIKVDGDTSEGFEDYRTLGLGSFAERYSEAI